MKKLAVCIFLLITVTSLAVLAFNAIPPGQDDKKLTKNGDVDYSGSVELEDAIMMFRRTAGKEVFDDFTEKVGDIDKSGSIGIQDTMKVFRHVAGKEELPLFPLFEDTPMPYDPETEYFTPKTELEKLIEQPQFDDFEMQIQNETEVVLLEYKGNDPDVIIPEGTTKINPLAFYYKTEIESIYIPESVTYIGNQAFAGCFGLKTITIPDSVKTIESRAFNCCISLESVNIPKTISLASSDAFSGCYKLKSPFFTDTQTLIDYRMYYYCTSLSEVNIPDQITTIGKEAFAFSSITEITIPESVTSIADDAFKECSSLLLIKGTKGSYAETFAAEHGTSFEEVSQ